MATPSGTVHSGKSPETYRTLHLLDIENLLGLPPGEARCDCYVSAFSDYITFVNPQPADHLVVGSHPRNALRIPEVLKHFNVEWRKGTDGGETVLIEYVRDKIGLAKVAARYDRVIVGSGDREFADLLKDLREAKVGCRVAGRAMQVSGQLVRAVGERNVTWLPWHFCVEDILTALARIAIVVDYLDRRSERADL